MSSARVSRNGNDIMSFYGPIVSGHACPDTVECFAEERRRVDERPFDAAAFYARVGATAREQSALRQDLVRGLKDYFTHLYGYDRYGAETVFLVPERMGQPHTFGFALLRILHDRRLS